MKITTAHTTVAKHIYTTAIVDKCEESENREEPGSGTKNFKNKMMPTAATIFEPKIAAVYNGHKVLANQRIVCHILCMVTTLVAVS